MSAHLLQRQKKNPVRFLLERLAKAFLSQTFFLRYKTEIRDFSIIRYLRRNTKHEGYQRLTVTAINGTNRIQKINGRPQPEGDTRLMSCGYIFGLCGFA